MKTTTTTTSSRLPSSGNGDDPNQRILDNKDVFFQSMTLASTYKQRTDLQLLGDQKVPVTEAVRALFYAPFVCCSHDETIRSITRIKRR